MALVNNNDLMVPGRRDGYAVGGFNTSNLEITAAIFQAAAEKRSPVIVATSQSAIAYAGYDNIRMMVDNMSREADIPASLHLDHGTDMDIIKGCIEHGWTSLMIDGSHFPFDENIAATKAVVDLAHPHGISVEAELGRLEGVEDEISVDSKDASMTDPNEAAQFVERTGVDSLAVAIGTSHGAYKFKGEPRLDIERLEKIAALVDIPLVLHGASAVPPEVLELAQRYGADLPGAKGVPADSIRAALEHGVAKVNIDTDLRLAFTGHVRQILTESPKVFDPRKILAAARDGMAEVIKAKMDLFGSAGRV